MYVEVAFGPAKYREPEVNAAIPSPVRDASPGLLVASTALVDMPGISWRGRACEHSSCLHVRACILVWRHSAMLPKKLSGMLQLQLCRCCRTGKVITSCLADRFAASEQGLCCRSCTVLSRDLTQREIHSHTTLSQSSLC